MMMMMMMMLLGEYIFKSVKMSAVCKGNRLLHGYCSGATQKVHVVTQGPGLSAKAGGMHGNDASPRLFRVSIAIALPRLPLL